jgi:hypothetical protein
MGDAIVQTITSTMRHPKTVAALGAGLVARAHTDPVVLTGGTPVSTIAWIAYELRRRNKNTR